MVVALELLPERNCSKCTATQKIQWGCDGNAKQKLEFMGRRLDHCPRRPLLDDPEHYGQIFWLYRQYTKGYLPEKGGLFDQPAKFIDYIRVMDRALDYCREQREERDRAKAALSRRP